MTSKNQDDDIGDDEKHSSTDFVDQLDNDEKWEVLNAQKDISIHLYTQTIRLCQVLLTLIGLTFTGLAVFGPGSVASVFQLEDFGAAREVIGFWSWLLLFVIMLTHLFWAFAKGLVLLSTIGIRVALDGLAVHPIVGDEIQTNSDDGKLGWIRANQLTIASAEDDLRNAYMNLTWLFIHLLLAIVLFYAVTYQSLMLLYGLGTSTGVIFMIALIHMLPTDENRRQSLLRKVTDEPPHQGVRMILGDLYERSEATSNSRIGTWRQFITQAWYFLLILPHLIISLTLII
ncbi:hypothetical protein [Salinigranum salinum]|uniref:hypothetical protein n=1 Tax=Salinigranum salinum TaxID=1364937 RepID=UPI0012610C3E|nr:hypothetical protein [Salinigranum salinum]